MAVKKINSLNAHQNPATNENEFDIENYLNENWEKIIDVVDNNADELTELNDKSDTNIQSLQEEISELEEDVKANSIIVTTEEATSLQINDANGSRAKLNIKGNYKQEGTPSRNSPAEIETVGGNINLLNSTVESQTINGVTLTVNKDKSITAKGKSTGLISLQLAPTQDIEKGEYTLSGCTSGNNNTYFIQTVLSNANPSGGKYFSNYAAPHTFKVEADNNRQFTQIIIRANVTIDETFYPKLEKGKKATSYSRPGQAGISVKKISKNFANTSILKALNLDAIEINSKNSFTIDLSKGTLNSIQGKVNILFNAPKNKQYTLSYHVEQNNTTFLPKLCFGYTDGSTQNISSQTASSYDAQGTSQEGKEINSIFLSWGTQGSGGIATISNIQLEAGTQKTNFEEYTEEIKTVDIQQEMLTGDCFDLERGKEVHTWNILELTGNENWVSESGLEKTIRMRTGTGKLSNNYVGKCTHFVFIGNYNLDEEHCYATSAGALYVFIDKTVVSTPAEFKQYLSQQKEAGTPVKVYWKSNTTTELDLTETQIEQLEQLNKMRTYKEQTNIVTVEDLALMQLEYSQDLKAYIDSKLSTN